MMAAMCEETGEVARVINCLYGDKNVKNGENLKNLEEELGDLLFTIICLANANHISLNKALEKKFKNYMKEIIIDLLINLKKLPIYSLK